MDLRFLVSISNFLNTMIQLFLIGLVIRLVFVYIIGESNYESQPWILFVSIGVACLYFVNVGYLSIQRVNYLDTKLLNIDFLYIMTLLGLLIGTLCLIQKYKSIEEDINDVASLLVLTMTIATNFWAPRVTKYICKFILGPQKD